MSSVLVTGSSGFIGTPVVHAFLDNGHEVAGLDLVPPRVGGYRHEAIDIRDQEALARYVQQTEPEIVIHLAALHYIPYCNEHPTETVAINVQGTKNILDSLAGADVKRFFLASTAAVYLPSAHAHRETDDVCPMDVYGLSKAFAEELVHRYLSGDIGLVIGRLFNVYGPGDPHPHVIPELVTQLRPQLDGGALSVQLGNMTPGRDYIHVSDVARAIYLLTTTAAEDRCFNVGSGVAVSVSGLVDLLTSALDRPIEVTQSEARVRPVDRPVLMADASRLRSLGWEPQVELGDGLPRLLVDE